MEGSGVDPRLDSTRSNTRRCSCAPESDQLAPKPPHTGGLGALELCRLEGSSSSASATRARGAWTIQRKQTSRTRVPIGSTLRHATSGSHQRDSPGGAGSGITPSRRM